MWYRKAYDLRELALQNPKLKSDVAGEFDNQVSQEAADDLLTKLESGEEYTSPSGAIRVNPRIETQSNEENNDQNAITRLTTTDYEEMHGIVSDQDTVIQRFIDLSKTLDRYIPANSDFTKEMESLKSYFVNLRDALYDVIRKEQAKFPKMRQHSATHTSEEQEEVYAHNAEVRNFFATYEPPQLDEQISHQVNAKLDRMIYLINQVAPKIMSKDGKTEWLNLMVKLGVDNNYLPDNLKSQYNKIYKQTYRGYY